MIRVLHFYKTYLPDTYGGIEQVISQIARGTERHGVVTQVLSLSSRPIENSVMVGNHLAKKAKLDVQIASTGMSFSVFGAFARMARDADIVHYHFPWPVMDLAHLAQRVRKPSVVTYHSDIVRQQRVLPPLPPADARISRSGDTDRCHLAQLSGDQCNAWPLRRKGGHDPHRHRGQESVGPGGR